MNTTAAAEHECGTRVYPERRGRRTRRPLTAPRIASLLFLFVVQHAGPGVAPATIFPQIVTSNYYVRAGTGRTVTAGDRAERPGGNNTSDMY